MACRTSKSFGTALANVRLSYSVSETSAGCYLDFPNGCRGADSQLAIHCDKISTKLQNINIPDKRLPYRLATVIWHSTFDSPQQRPYPLSMSFRPISLERLSRGRNSSHVSETHSGTHVVNCGAISHVVVPLKSTIDPCVRYKPVRTLISAHVRPAAPGRQACPRYLAGLPASYAATTNIVHAV